MKAETLHHVLNLGAHTTDTSDPDDKSQCVFCRSKGEKFSKVIPVLSEAAMTRQQGHWLARMKNGESIDQINYGFHGRHTCDKLSCITAVTETFLIPEVVPEAGDTLEQEWNTKVITFLKKISMMFFSLKTKYSIAFID